MAVWSPQAVVAQYGGIPFSAGNRYANLNNSQKEEKGDICSQMSPSAVPSVLFCTVLYFPSLFLLGWLRGAIVICRHMKKEQYLQTDYFLC